MYILFLVGLLLSATTTPICVAALTSTNSDVDRSGLPRELSLPERLCLGSRAVLWISEIPGFRHSPEYTTHHVFSLASLGLTLLSNLPLRPLYLIYAGLVTELASDTIALFRLHGMHHDPSRPYLIVSLLNVVGILFLRVIPAVTFAVAYLQPSKGLATKAYGVSVCFYCGWLLTIAFKQLRNLGYVKLDLERPVSVLLGGRLRISIFSLLLGLAMAVAQISTRMIYCLNQKTALSDAEEHSMAITGLGAAFSGLVGAKFVNDRMSGTMEALPVQSKLHLRATATNFCSDQSTLHSNYTGRARCEEQPHKKLNRQPRLENTLKRQVFEYLSLQGISIQGGLLFATTWVMLGCTLSQSIDRMLLLHSMSISLPLGESIGRLGCYFGGCCGSKLDAKGKSLFPAIQLLSAGLNMAIFCTLAVPLATGRLSVEQAGTAAMALNSVVRLTVNPLRDGERTMMAATNGFAMCQLLVSGAFLIAMQMDAGTGMLAAFLITIMIAAVALSCSSIIVLIWISAVPLLLRSRKAIIDYSSWFSRPITYVYAFGVCVVTIVCSDSQRHHSTNVHGAMANAISSHSLPHTTFLTCAAVIGCLPMVLMSTWTPALLEISSVTG